MGPVILTIGLQFAWSTKKQQRNTSKQGYEENSMELDSVYRSPHAGGYLESLQTLVHPIDLTELSVKSPHEDNFHV